MVAATKGQILEIIPALMADIGHIPKERRNAAQGYKFRSVDQVLAALHPLLVKYRLTPSTRVEHHVVTSRVEQKAGGKGERVIYQATLTLSVTLSAPDGSSVRYEAAGEGQDYGGDKATNKAMSMAYKYALCLGLAIPVDETTLDDSDADEGDKSSVKEAPATTAADDKPRSQSGRTLSTKADPRSQGPDDPISEQQRERIISTAKVCGMGAKDITALLAAKGIAKLADLTSAGADKMIAGLDKKAREMGADSLQGDGDPF